MSRKLIALDVDGTVLTETGELLDAVRDEVQRVAAEGHFVTLATGRSVAMTLPVLDRLGISPEYVVCSNGAVTLKRNPDAPTGYVRDWVETFDPTEVLTTIRHHLGDVNYAVEDSEGLYRFVGEFPDGALGAVGEQVPFEQLLHEPATRVVVISPGHELEDFLSIVGRMGLHQVSYNVGWAAWLDIAPDGVTKATALERMRALLDIPRADVIAIGDGRNDIDMLEWAAAEGRGAAMGQAPDVVLAAANEVTGNDFEAGVSRVLASV
jgi:hydroxymethylpyrimidine pyrophosphatase-like HAD family hydrolase